MLIRLLKELFRRSPLPENPAGAITDSRPQLGRVPFTQIVMQLRSESTIRTGNLRDDSILNDLAVCRYGVMIYNRYDVYIGRSLELYGEYSEKEVDIFRTLISPKMVVLDVGANVGTHTLYFAQAVGPLGAVHAFEPQRMIFDMLAGNVALNSATNVYCHQKALGAHAGSIMVPALDYAAINNFGGLELRESAQGERVEMMKIDDLALPCIDFIKLDVEGMEQKVLEGAINSIQLLRPVLYVENDRREKSEDLVRFIHSLGYVMYWHKPQLFNPANFAGNRENVFGNVASINILCVPAEKDMKPAGLRRVDVNPKNSIKTEKS